jgi:hypothetical protein
MPQGSSAVRPTNGLYVYLLPCIVIDFFLNNQTDALIIPILFCYKTAHVSGIFFYNFAMLIHCEVVVGEEF